MTTATATPLTKDAVYDVAMELMKNTGSTTSLEVKEELRKKDYWALQKEVSNMLQELCDEHGWDKNNNGTFNVYSIPSSSTVPTPQLTSSNHHMSSGIRKQPAVINDSNNPSNNPRVTINIDAEETYSENTATKNDIASDIKQRYSPKTRVAYCPSSGDVAVYDEKYSSDHVRTAFARLIGRKIQDTRSCTVDHIDNWTL